MLSRPFAFAASWVFLLWMAISPLTAQSPLNLLVITVDDMSCDSVGVYGCQLADTTPNMDAFARTALRFEYAHVQVGNCMPSRNVMWSGRYPHNNGVEGFYQVRKIQYPVLCDLARSAGYFTAIRHKISHSTPYSPYAWDLELDQLPGGSRPHVKDAESYGDSMRQAIAASEEAGKPFCVLINISDPHKPFYSEVKQGVDPHVPSHVFQAEEVPVPGFLPDDPAVKQELALYYSSVRRADDGVGKVLQALQESGLDDRTLVLFLSDHGMPLPFAKTQLYHHSTRTPLMVRWPGVTPPDSLDQRHMVSAVDLLPTLAEIMHWDIPQDLDGRSFAALLRGESQADREYIVKEYNENSGAKRNPMRALQTKDYLYIFNPWSDGKRLMATATNGTSSWRRMKMMALSNSEVAARVDLMEHRVLEELYDVREDPDCLVNLINSAEHESAANELRERLLEHMRSSGDPLAEVFEERGDPSVLQAYMTSVQAEADARRKNRNPRQRPQARKK
ncbi:MAG: sulfatase [bacterium]|nr:sulfatase [bacterium]